MKVQYDPDFLKKLKKVDVRIRKSIDVTVDYRAFYEEVHEGEEMVVYFSALGTHEVKIQK